MYKADDVVMYGIAGLCRVTAVEKRDFFGEERDYFVLRRINSYKNEFYVPADQAAGKKHKVCSKEEADALISCMNECEPIWIDDDKERKEEYGRIIKRADKQELIILIRTLYIRKNELSETGKRLCSMMRAVLRSPRKCCMRNLPSLSELSRARLSNISKSISHKLCAKSPLKSSEKIDIMSI